MREAAPSGRTTACALPITLCHWNHTVTNPSASDKAKNGVVRSRSRPPTFPRRHHVSNNSTAGSITTDVFASRASRNNPRENR